MQRPLASAVSMTFEHFASKIEQGALNPAPAQEKALRSIVRTVGRSRTGRRFGLDRVGSLGDARGLPPTQYSDLEDGIRRARTDAPPGKNIFGSAPIVAWGLTSGSTGQPKYLPLTDAFLKSYRRFMRSAVSCLVATMRERREMIGGKHLFLVARPVTGRAPGGLPEGFISGFMAARMPRLFRKSFLPGKEVLSIPSWEEKTRRIFRLMEGEDLQSITGIPPFVVNFSEKAMEYFGIRSLNEKWPGLKVFVSGGVALNERICDRIRRLWGRPDVRFFELYAATEGQFGHSFRPEWPGMVFNPYECFFQFTEGTDRDFLQLHELKKGRNYNVFVTTPGGLINYRMGDVVEIMSVDPLTFRVAGREKEEISLATEKITADQVEPILRKAGSALGLTFDDFVIWVEIGDPNRLVWGLPNLGGKSQEELRHIGETIDSELRAGNPSYDELRMSNIIYGPCRVFPIPSVLFSDYRERNLDRGQFKERRLFSNYETFAEEYHYKPS